MENRTKIFYVAWYKNSCK
jgi:hypothetical protein